MAKKITARSRTKRVRRVKSAKPAAAVSIQCWLTDPMSGLPPLRVSAPDMPGAALATRVVQPATAAPPPQIYTTGTAEFRYWSTAETLRRAAKFWQSVGAKAWNPVVGSSLPVRLDDGVDLNAYYARTDFLPQRIKQGLSFFHDTVRDATSGRQVTVFSAESPDVVAHELGHAVLDSIKPALWGLAVIEAAAFHESFGDMSAILTSLQVPEVRQAALEETGGKLGRSSLVSRVAEQLGFAIRQRQRDAVDPDSLRNAANAFRYADPLTLPVSGPAAQLTQRAHNFSRVFTGAFLEALGGMVAVLSSTPKESDVLQAAQDMGSLLVRAIAGAPVRTKFFQAIAEQLVLADTALFRGKYAEALTKSFVRRGLLPVRSFATPSPIAPRSSQGGVAAAVLASVIAGGGTDESGRAHAAAKQSVKIPVDGSSLGMPTKLYVEAPPSDDMAMGAGSVLATTSREAAPSDRYAAVQAFLEGLMARGRIAASPSLSAHALLMEGPAAGRVTHHLVKAGDGVELRRLIFECGH